MARKKNLTTAALSATQPDTADTHARAGHGRNIKDGRSMKTSDQIADGGNIEERDDPMANNDSPVLVQNIVDVNMKPGKSK